MRSTAGDWNRQLRQRSVQWNGQFLRHFHIDVNSHQSDTWTISSAFTVVWRSISVQFSRNSADNTIDKCWILLYETCVKQQLQLDTTSCKLAIPYTGVYAISWSMCHSATGTVCNCFISKNLMNNNDINAGTANCSANAAFSLLSTSLSATVHLLNTDYINIG